MGLLLLVSLNGFVQLYRMRTAPGRDVGRVKIQRMRGSKPRRLLDQVEGPEVVVRCLSTLDAYLIGSVAYYNNLVHSDEDSC